MAAPSSSNVSAAKPPPLSYADRARRAGASQPAHSAPRARPSGPNGKTRSGDESTSPASSSRNLTPNSTAALTLPGSPPPSSSQTSIEEQQAFPPMPKSPSRPPLTNVWAVRREQRERATAGQQPGRASASVQTESPPQQSSIAINRGPVNGINTLSSLDDSMSGDHDPFVVRIPPHGHPLGRANASSASRTPPSLDDVDSWPEMGKGAPSSSTSVSGSIAESDKKDTPSKKAEKPKWVQIPPAELQAAHDAQSAANSRSHSQHRKNNQAKSRSRQQSQARPNQNQNANRSHNQNVSYVAGLSNGSGAGPKPGETSSVQSRAESTTHSRTTSVHSSPRIGMRGRRLPEDQPAAPNTAAGPSTTAAKKLPNGITTVEEQPQLPQPMEVQGVPPAQRPYQENPVFAGPPQSLSAPHSQSHTPYSHSPVYYPPPPNSGPQGFAYGPIPTSSGYVIPPPPAPSPGSGGPGMQQQGFVAYAPYGIPQQFPPGQPPFPYMYQPVPYPYYPAPMPDQQQQQFEPQAPPPQENTQQGDSMSTHLSPVLPPASTITKPPRPEESGPLSGYRTIAAVPVSPLLGGSVPRQSTGEVAEGGAEMVFGSVGQPGGLKSPSPAPVPPAASSMSGTGKDGEKSPAAFAVGFEGSTAVRMRRTASGKDVVDDLADSIKVIDLTDKGSKWQFGTSMQVDSELVPNETGEQSGEGFDPNRPVPQQQNDPQILQPQPHHMLHYPPPNVSPAFQVGGYNMVPQMHLHLPSMPLPSQSPQNNVQPLPTHVPSLAPLPMNPGFVSPLVLSSPGPGPQSSGVPVPMSVMQSGGDDFEVVDYGYGFGQGYMPERRDERFERDNYRDNSRDYGAGRMRRSSTTGSYGSSYFEGGRGGFGGRRGRGQNSFGRGFSRGGFAGRGGHGGFQRHQPSLSVSTGPFQQQQNVQQPQAQMSPDISNPSGYFVSPTTGTSQYIASPYGQFNPTFVPPQSQVPPSAQPQSQFVQHHQAPPVPMPVTTLSFPLDPTRLYLLGQLEYYFGAQNLASDIYLKKQMDSKGWIPIPLIASFNRVRQFTQDAQVVKEVLGISSLVEVRGNHVRLANQQWVNYVLPGAAESTVESEEVEKETEEGEEDDVVFILGGEESRPWVGAT